MMLVFAILIFIMCYCAGIKTLIDAVKSWEFPLSRYLFAKGIVIVYLGTVYGIVVIDYWFDIVNYPVDIVTHTGQFLRMAGLIASAIFLADTWIRNRK